MLSITDRTTARQVIHAVAGVTPPQRVVDAYERAQRLSSAVNSLGVAPDALPAAVMAALDKGRDPGADREVQRLTTLVLVANPATAIAVDAAAFQDFARVCTEDADAVIAVWAGPFTAAATVLVDAAATLGRIELSDADTVIRQGAAAVDAWTKAQAAVTTLDGIANGWAALGDLTRLGGADRRYRVLRTATATYQQWRDLDLEHRRLTPWQTIQAGLTLSLPTFRQYRDRVAVIQAGQSAEAADLADDQLRYATGRPSREQANHRPRDGATVL